MSRLYHISFQGNLSGKWQPRLPAGTPEFNAVESFLGLFKSSDKSITEPRIPRISLSSTIKGCFRGIYPNISNLFEERNYPHLDMYVYEPENDDYKIVDNNTLIEKKYVYDAHVTKEVWIKHPVDMVIKRKIRVFNTTKQGFKEFYPFGDSSYGFKCETLKVVDFETLEVFKTIVAKESLLEQWV